MVRAPNHHDTIITLETIDSVQEEALDLIRNKAVKVLKHQKTWRRLPRFYENLTD